MQGEQRSAAIDDDEFGAVRATFDEGEIVEIAAVAGAFNYFNRFNNASTSFVVLLA